MGGGFSAKDFRTWAGTLVCACALARAGIDLADTKTDKKKKIVAAIRETAEPLATPRQFAAPLIFGRTFWAVSREAR